MRKKKETVNLETMFETLDKLHKEGYSNIAAFPTWLMNDYRELTVQKAKDIVNLWITNRKIKHDYLR